MIYNNSPLNIGLKQLVNPTFSLKNKSISRRDSKKHNITAGDVENHKMLDSTQLINPTLSLMPKYKTTKHVNMELNHNSRPTIGVIENHSISIQTFI